MEFVTSNKEMIPFELKIMNSHPEYNLLAEGKRILTDEDMLEEHEEGKELAKERYLMKVEEDYIGIIDFVMRNPRDEKPWLGLLIIHQSWSRQGKAEKALAIYEDMMKERGIREVRLGCFEANAAGLAFWEKTGFQRVKKIEFREKPLWIMEKALN
ncbi:GNAT family N-acetyltransferase [Mesobacillus subterraneus]|nr:GNAT family N-acetyltransferase [Mesobacillus subterraneus]